MSRQVMTVYIIEIKTGDQWVPMYAPCYDLTTARAKSVSKVRTFGSDCVRIGKYQREETVADGKETK